MVRQTRSVWLRRRISLSNSSSFSAVLRCALLLLALLLPAADTPPASAMLGAGVQPLIVYARGSEMPQEVIDAFVAESGVPVKVVIFDTPDGGEDGLLSGAQIDVTYVSNRVIPQLVAAGLLHPLDYQHLSNFKNISLNFRDLSFDPGNRYSIPYAWGASGIVARTDKLSKPITDWIDLWDEAHCGHIAVWSPQYRQVIGATLKSLGYSANSENPAELAAARERLRVLRPCVRVLTGTNVMEYIPDLVRGELIIGVGNPHEAYALRSLGFPFYYYQPQEGMLLWGDSFVVAANSTQPEAAEQFINFLLRPEIGAELANANFYQLANEAARPLIAPDLLADPMLYQTSEMLRHAEILLPLSQEGEARYAVIWQEFTGAVVD